MCVGGHMYTPVCPVLEYNYFSQECAIYKCDTLPSLVLYTLASTHVPYSRRFLPGENHCLFHTPALIGKTFIPQSFCPVC